MTIRKLARLAGVSHPTVSRALRNSPLLSRETRERIQALAKKHGYHPHPMVSKLMAQLPHVRTIARSTLAIVTSWPDWRQRLFPCEIYAGIQARAEEFGYTAEEFPMSGYRMSSSRLSDVLYARGIEGVIIFPLERSSGHLSLKWPRFTSVAIGRTLTRPSLHSVTFNVYENLMLAYRQLQRLGYRRIALALVSDLRPRVGDAYVAAYGVMDRAIPAIQRIPILDRPAFTPAEVAQWLGKYEADALICNYNPTPEELRAEGIQIPQQLGYATLDRFQATADVTGIDQRPRDVGAAAVDILTAHMHRNERGVPEIPQQMLIPGAWVEAQTVRKHSAPAASKREKHRQS